MFYDQRSGAALGICMYVFKIHNPLVQNPHDREVLNQGVMSGGLRPPILKFSFQVDV